MRQLKISKRFTEREAKSLDKFLNELGKIRLLDPDEEIDLARRIKSGDQVALDILTKSNLKFVVSVAKQYQNQGLELGDLINEGSIGLAKSALRFDETRGFKFISYAVWWIRQSILSALADHSKIVRQPLNRHGLTGKINEKISDLEQELQREPTDEEIMEALNIDKESFRYYREHKKAISLDMPIGEDGENTLLDIQSNGDDPVDSVLMKESLNIELRRLINRLLKDKEKEVLIYYFGLDGGTPLTLEDISEKIGLTRERVRQIKEKSIRRLGRNLSRKILRSYL